MALPIWPSPASAALAVVLHIDSCSLPLCPVLVDASDCDHRVSLTRHPRGIRKVAQTERQVLE